MRKTFKSPLQFFAFVCALFASIVLVQVAKSAIVNHGKHNKAVVLNSGSQFTSQNGFRYIGSDQYSGSMAYQKGNTTYIVPFKR
jgi:hypothetical protein